MQATEKHYERRCNKRRHDDRRNNPRGGNLRRSNPGRSKVRRSSARLNRSFEVSVLDYEGKTVNVSARGVYFEVITNDLEVFLPGATIPLRINAVTNMSEDQERKYKLSGRGTVNRSCVIEDRAHASRLGVALEFIG